MSGGSSDLFEQDSRVIPGHKTHSNTNNKLLNRALNCEKERGVTIQLAKAAG